METPNSQSQNCLESHDFFPFENNNTYVTIILLNYFYCRHFIQWMGSSFQMHSRLVLLLFIVKCLRHVFTAHYSYFLLKILGIFSYYLNGLSNNAYTSRIWMIQELSHLHTLHSEGEIVLDEELRDWKDTLVNHEPKWFM